MPTIRWGMRFSSRKLDQVGARHAQEVCRLLRRQLTHAIAITLTRITRTRVFRSAGWPSCRRWKPVGRRRGSLVQLRVRGFAGSSLTGREEVLALALRGYANPAIAAHLGVSGRAVELHITALFDRVGVESRAASVVQVLTSFDRAAGVAAGSSESL